MFRDKKCGTRSKHAKKAKNATKAKVVEATKKIVVDSLSVRQVLIIK